MPGTPALPPTPKSLHQALNNTRPLDWGTSTLSVAEIAHLYGPKATKWSMELLAQAARVEPAVTDQFLEALPSHATAYHLSHRVKSPESLARKLKDWSDSGRNFPVDDVLRYTALTESADELVATARDTVEALNNSGWQVKAALHSYTDGSRYKGLHLHMKPPGFARTELQIHSIASVRVKEQTTEAYQIERSASATSEERKAAREHCVELSATLTQPAGIDDLHALGGRRVKVRNYSDSRSQGAPPQRQLPQSARSTTHPAAIEKNGGIAR